MSIIAETLQEVAASKNNQPSLASTLANSIAQNYKVKAKGAYNQGPNNYSGYGDVKVTLPIKNHNSITAGLGGYLYGGKGYSGGEVNKIYLGTDTPYGNISGTVGVNHNSGNYSINYTKQF